MWEAIDQGPEHPCIFSPGSPRKQSPDHSVWAFCQDGLQRTTWKGDMMTSPKEQVCFYSF